MAVDPFVLLDPGALGTGGSADVVALPADVTTHLRTVLRLEPGAAVVLADGAGVSGPAVLLDEGARLTGPLRQVPAPRPTVHVLQGLAKGRKVDEVIRTLTELGVDRVTPIAAARSVTRLDGAKQTKAVARWEAVARSACEQARRSRVPRIDAPMTVTGVCAELGGADVVVAHVGATEGLSEALAAGGAGDRLVLAVGPEGGWTDEEVARFRSAGARVAGMGPTVLRTEHAAPALAAVVAFSLGRWR